jgi:hypothetical protein
LIVQQPGECRSGAAGRGVAGDELGIDRVARRRGGAGFAEGAMGGRVAADQPGQVR